MPKVKSYSAAWLSTDAPGNQLFEPLPDSLRSRALQPTKKKPPPGPRRTIARRGTEVFVAVGKEIRWGNLVYLKEAWTDKQSKNGSDATARRDDSAQSSPSSAPESEFLHGMRTIRTPLADDIRQLIISPNSNYLAILTTHTAHICALPDSSHLTSEDTSPLKPKMFTLGPTTHVTSRSPIVSAVWHPLGVNGSCLVTVTSDAIVRLWELSTQDRWSFDSPTSSIDLRKLADGTSLEQDFSASVSTTNKGFSPDEFDMEVAAASFGSKSSGGWNPMTLWIAMRGGDVYALCPLLPQRWAPPPTLIPSLSVSVVTNVGSIEDDPMVDEADKLLAQQQLQWMSEIDAQGPHIIDPVIPGDQPVEVYTRPSKPGAVPRLQGPFDLQCDPETGDELDTSITDILVIGRKAESEDLFLGEEDDAEQYEDGDQQGLSLAIVCLLSTSGQVRVYIDSDGVQGQWLPPKSKSRLSRCLADIEPPSLLAFQAIDTMTAVEVNEDSWPVFSKDVMSRYSFFVTHHEAIHFISFTSWVFRLESELSGDFEAGTDFRLGLLVNSQSVREKLFAQPTADASAPLAAAVAFRDPDLGYLLLSATPYEPVALTFDTPDDDASPARPESPSLSHEQDMSMAPLDFHEPRPVYQPSHIFNQSSALPGLLEDLRKSRHKMMVNAEVKLSPLTLNIFTDAHTVLSEETHRLGVAAAEVFRRCEMLQAELQQQVRTVNEVRGKIDAINGAHRDDQESENAMYERRIGLARERQERLAGRLDSLRKMAGKAAVRELSAKERAFVEEVKTMEMNVLGPAAESETGAAAATMTTTTTATSTAATTTTTTTKVATGAGTTLGPSGPGGRNQARQLWKRLEEVRRVQVELLAEAEALRKPARGEGSATPELRIPQDVRRSKMQQVQGLLSRESALVDAVTSRLERLQASL